MISRISFTLTGIGRTSGALKGRSSLTKTNHCDGNRTFQQSAQATRTELPKLPVPPLQQTLQKYLRTVKPLITDDEFRITEKVVKEFGAPKGFGEKLQLLLEHRAEMSQNWLSDWWLSAAYMDFRSPVVVHSSPGLIFPLQNFQSKDDQLRFAAKMIAAALDYKTLIDNNEIPLEKMGKNPLDMSQYSKIFSTCRIPGKRKDSLQYFSKNRPTHIVVAHNNHFFKLNVYDGSGQNLLSDQQILKQLQELVSKSGQPTLPVGILTTENRNVWGKAYQKLKNDNKNVKSLDDIQQAIFFVSIDQPNPKMDLNKQTVTGLQMLHGCGSKANAGNRWYDKTIQFIIGAAGEVGLTYEHSPAEGPPIANLMDYIMRNFGKQVKRDSTSADIMPLAPLEFNITDDIKEEIEVAKRNLDVLVDDLDLTIFTFKGYGKSFIKSQKLSPDSFIQMAIQLTFYRIHGEPGSCYESASLRQFHLGRTDTIRSTSVESVEFCKEMMKPQSVETAVSALKKAITSHKQYVTDAVNGQGVDRHLLGLKLIAIDNKVNVPQLYMDTGFVRSTHFKISTSQVAAESDSVMCYGPLVPDGYGCCYNPRPNEMNFGVSAFNSSPETNAKKFQEALEKSLNEMHDVLVRSQKAKL